MAAAPLPPLPHLRAPAAAAARHRRRALALAPLFVALIRAEWRHHPWRQAAAVLAVALGVALGFAVQLINTSALAEFEQAVHAASGAPDFSLRAPAGLLDEAAYEVAAQAGGVLLASPVVEVQATLRDAAGRPQPVTVLGLDVLIAPWISPGWLPQPEPGDGSDPRLGAFDPDRVWLNPAARQLLGAATTVELRAGGAWQRLAIGGHVDADGPPLIVMDIAGAQTHFDRLGRLSRIDVRLAPGASAQAVRAALDALPATAGLRAAAPDESALRMARLSQSYRVNLSVLALVALFTGAFLVFSVQSLAVAKRMPQLALLGVLGLDGRARRHLVWADSLLVGVLGSACGLALGSALAVAALAALGGDLGSGLLGSAAPQLHWSAMAALAYGALGCASAFAGGWWPARAAEGIAPAQGLKGLSGNSQAPWPTWAALGLIALSVALAFVPPWGDIPWAAYASVGVLLLGGIGMVPVAVGTLLGRFAGAEHPVVALAVARAVDQRQTATAAVAGVVASLALVVALTVMVTSFRDSLAEWLGEVLPADLYLRPAGMTGSGSRGEAVYLDPALIQALRRQPGVQQWRGQRLEPIALAPDQPVAVLIARDEPESGEAADGTGRAASTAGPPAVVPPLPWVEAPRPMPPAPGVLSVHASEVLAALHHLHRGDLITLPLPAPAGPVRARVDGIWRDYARQQGALVMARSDWLRLTHDERLTDAAVWLRRGPGAPAAAEVARALQAAAPASAPIDTATPGEIRAISLRIFDRSFAVTRWLQGVAMAIGLAGIAASFSAQVLARRREFGTLQHLGFTRRQVLALVAAEGALWTAVGALLGLALGLAVSLVLVHVVNPQSFHWTMRWSVPVAPLAALVGVTVAAGALTAWLAAQGAAGRDMARAVKEDW